MPAEHASGVRGITGSSELNRDLAGVQGTYGWSVQSAAVTFSTGLTFAYASAAAGDYTVNSVAGTAITGSTLALATQDPTNPRVDIIVTTVAGAVSSVAGTPAALTTTSGPVPPTPTSAQLEIARIFVPATGTALSASSITDRRHPLVSAAVVALGGSSSAATSTTSTSAVDLVTMTTSIAVGKFIDLCGNFRKLATAANAAAVGLKINATTVMEATAASNGFGSTSATQRAEDGMFWARITPRSASTYLNGIQSYHGARVSATGADAGGVGTQAFMAGLTASIPNATITSLIIRGINDTNSNSLEVFDVKALVY